MQEEGEKYIHGRGAQFNTANPYLRTEVVQEHIEGIDEPLISDSRTEYLFTDAKTIVNKVESPDIGLSYSMNPYQGCEHGCIYCYARNTHQYWGYSAGLDFERKILIKKNAAQLLEKLFLKKSWEPYPIMLSGNTDCYQPIEKKMGITRGILEVCLKYKHPVGLISKNALILRDLDILSALAKDRLVHVMISLTSLKEDLRQKMEPRTVTAKNRLKVMKALSDAGVPVGVMTAPIIPGLNSEEIPQLIKQAALHGAINAGYTMVRLNGAIGDIFHDWLYKSFPDAADKVWNQISEVHGGQVNDSRMGVRMKGEGAIAESVKQLFQISVKKYIGGKVAFRLNTEAFNRSAGEAQLSLF
jgi:DNA repair photolyase